jgi:hypothetical protein
MTKSNKIVSILWQPVRWSRANSLYKKEQFGCCRTFAAQFMARFQATKATGLLRNLPCEEAAQIKALFDRLARFTY